MAVSADHYGKAGTLGRPNRLPVSLAMPTHYEHCIEMAFAQEFALTNRELMMVAICEAVQDAGEVPPFQADVQAVNCHHNYVAREHHYGVDVLLTRKGAVRARVGDLGIIPGSMGAQS